MKIKKFNLAGNSIEELRKSAEKYAETAGIKLNPDKEAVNKILKAMLMKKEKNGKLYCPCRVLQGNRQKDEEITCPCVFQRGEIELQKRCHCNLFVES